MILIPQSEYKKIEEARDAAIAECSKLREELVSSYSAISECSKLQEELVGSHSFSKISSYMFSPFCFFVVSSQKRSLEQEFAICRRLKLMKIHLF